MRVSMLRRVDLDRTVFIGEGTVPVRALAAGAGIAERDWKSRPVQRVKQLQADIREIGIGDHHRTIAIADGVPGVKRGDSPLDAGIDIDSADALVPIDKCQFAPAGDPAFVRDPFARRALVEAAVACSGRA